MKQPPFHANGLRYFTLPDGSQQCTGAMMGRRDYIPSAAAPVCKMHLVRVRPVGGDYDKGGAYWGALRDRPLFCAWGDSETEQAVCYVRAASRDAARIAVRGKFRNARFYR